MNMNLKKQEKKSDTEQNQNSQLTGQKQYRLIQMPSKFIDPMRTYRMSGDFHLYSNADYIVHSKKLGLGISCQNPYKKISNIIYNEETQRVTLQYSQIDFSITPWEMVVDRLQSLGDREIYKLSNYIQAFHQQLKNGLDDKQENMVQKITEYRSSAQYQYKYIKDLNQIIISQFSLDTQLIQDLGFELHDFIQFCFRYGIPEFSLKPNSTNQEYCETVMEFIKPIVEPKERQDFYFYTQKYPHVYFQIINSNQKGLKASVQFEKNYPPNDNTNFQLINLDVFFTYDGDAKSMPAQSKLINKNCLMKYYNIGDLHIKRCGFEQRTSKKTKI